MKLWKLNIKEKNRSNISIRTKINIQIEHFISILVSLKTNLKKNDCYHLSKITVILPPSTKLRKRERSTTL